MTLLSRAVSLRRGFVVEWSRRVGSTPAGRRRRLSQRYVDERQAAAECDAVVRRAGRRQPRRLLPLCRRASPLRRRRRLSHRRACALGTRTYAIDTACLKPCNFVSNH